ncbi:MAG: helix-turn-helix domain-containing protein [Pyrinomonadaceae bacterium]
MHDNRMFYANEEAKSQRTTSRAAVFNRLEVLKVLSGTVLREVESLREDKETATQTKIDLAAEVERFEIDLIRGALIRSGGRQSLAAQMLGIKTSTLNNKIKRYGITSNGLANHS